MRRWRLLLAAALLVAGLWVLGIPGAAVGHSQLVSSTPGSGELVATAPAEARLVFSEPLEPAYTSADLLDGEGRLKAERIGRIDAGDPRQLVVPLPTLADDAYSLAWRAVSAADGHGTQGFVTFAIGTTALPPGVGGYDPGSSGDIHAGHSGTTALAETQGRAASYLGLMLALGLAILGLVVIAPVQGSIPAGLVLSQAGALLVAGLGSGLLALSSGEAFASATAGAPAGSALDSLGYLLDSRTGVLLVGRTALGVVGAVAVFLLGRRRPRVGLLLAGAAGVVGIVLTVAGSHAAAFGSVAPVVAQGIHFAAGGVWLGGIVALAGGLATGALRLGDMKALVPRFSALALVSIALVALTGTYAMWLETGQLLSLDSGYATVLDVKILLFLGAIALGALNYLERPRAIVTRMPFARRISLEALLGTAVIIATALLASGSPPAGVRPIQIAPAPADAATDLAPTAASGASLGIQPARPGPNRLTVRLDREPPAGSTVLLRLQRLDVDQGTSDLPLSRLGTAEPVYGASGGSLAATSRWDATVVVAGADGVQLGRRRFVFALDASGISEGRALPPLDPAVAVAMVLMALGVLGLTFGMAGGHLPRTDPRAGRLSLVAGGTTAVLVGIVMTLSGPRP